MPGTSIGDHVGHASASAGHGASIGAATLFRDHAPFVAAFAHRLGARGSEVDDIVQDTFLLAHRRGGYRPGAASPTTFLARLTQEALHGARRRHRRFVKAHADEPRQRVTGELPDAPDAALHLHRMATELEEALEAIAPERRVLFILFELHGESCPSIAAAFGLKIGTVYSRIHAARKEFLSALDRIVGDGDPMRGER